MSVCNNREFTSDFLGLAELGAELTTQAITNEFVKHFHDAGLEDWMTNFVTLCTDRAAVNSGMYNSILPKLENCPKSADCKAPYCETFNRSVIKLQQIY